MKYMGMPIALWAIFSRSFRKNLETCFGLNATEAKEVTRKAKVRYKKIIRELPEFEKEDRFKMNIVSCAMIGAFVLSMPKRPDVKTLTNYYRDSSMTPRELVLPPERKVEIFRKRQTADAENGPAQSRRPQSFFLEYGLLRIS